MLHVLQSGFDVSVDFVTLAFFEFLAASSHPTGSQPHSFADVQVISAGFINGPPTAGMAHRLMISLQPLPSLILLSLYVPKRPATDPLISTRLPADPSFLRSKHQTPSSQHRQRSVPCQTEGKALLRRSNILRVAVECARCMKDRGKKEGRERIRGFRIGGVRILC